MIWKNLQIYKKTTKAYELRFKKNGIPEDITGWTIYFVVKENMEDTDANAKIFKKITSHIDATNGKTLIELTKDDTNLHGNYYYSVDYKDDEGNEIVLFNGRVKFVETVIKTRS